MERTKYLGKRIGPTGGGGPIEGIREKGEPNEAVKIGHKTTQFIQSRYPEVKNPHFQNDLEDKAKIFYPAHSFTKGPIE